MSDAHQPTPQSRTRAKTLAGYGMTLEHIAIIIGVDVKTLRKHYADDLEQGVAEANSLVSKSLFLQAVGRRERVRVMPDGREVVEIESIPPSMAAAAFWAKTRMRWRETDRLEITGKDGAAIQHDHKHEVAVVAQATETLTALLGQIAGEKRRKVIDVPPGDEPARLT